MTDEDDDLGIVEEYRTATEERRTEIRRDHLGIEVAELINHVNHDVLAGAVGGALVTRGIFTVDDLRMLAIIDKTFRGR